MFIFGNKARRGHDVSTRPKHRSESTRSSRRAGRTSRWLIAASLGGVAAVSVMAGTAGPAGAAIVATVPLATAAQYSVIGGSTVTNTGPSVLNQAVGLSPGSSITGFPPGVLLPPPGVFHAADTEAGQAQADLTTAYNNAAGRPVNESVVAELGGRTLVGGVYRSPTLGLTGALTLDGENNPNSVFIFQAGSTLTTASASSVILINGAQPCNVFWQIGDSATLGTNTQFVGNILALTSITLTTGATVQGRALARNGAVTLDTNTFTAPACDLTPITTPSIPGPTTPVATTPGATTPGAIAPGTTTPGGETPGETPGLSTIPGETIPSGAAPSTDLVGAAGPTFPAGPAGAGGTPGAFPELPSTGDNTLAGALTAAAVVALGLAALLIARRRPSTG